MGLYTGIGSITISTISVFASIWVLSKNNDFQFRWKYEDTNELVISSDLKSGQKIEKAAH